MGAFNNYVDNMRGEGVKKYLFSVYVHAQGVKQIWYKNCPRRGRGVKKWQNSVHVVVECPFITKNYSEDKLFST